MLKYQYKNCIVYITKPQKEHLKNIQKATKVFLKKVCKERSKWEQS